MDEGRLMRAVDPIVRGAENDGEANERVGACWTNVPAPDPNERELDCALACSSVRQNIAKAIGKIM